MNTSPTGARRAGWSAEAAAAPSAAMGAAAPTRPAFVGSTYRRAVSVGPRGPIYSSGEVSVFVVLVWRLSLDL